MSAMDSARWSWRFDGWGRRRRSLVLAGLVALALWGALAAFIAPVDHPVISDGQGDLDFYSLVNDRMEDGSNYYAAIDAEQADFGFPTRPVVTVREPTVAWFVTGVPDFVSSGVLIALALVASVLTVRLFGRYESSRTVWFATSILAVFSFLVLASPVSKELHEVWVALLLAVGLLTLPLGRGRLSMVLLLVAAMVRELMAPLMLVMAVVAWRSGRRREAAEWVVVTSVFGLFYLWHVWQVVSRVDPADVESAGWLTWRGWPGAVDAFGLSTLMTALPTAIVSVLAVLGVSGWVLRSGRIFTAVGGALLFNVALLMIAGRDNTGYWGMYVGALVVVGIPSGCAAAVALVRPATPSAA